MDMISSQETRRRTQGSFSRPLIFKEIIGEYLPYLKENIPDAEITYNYKAHGKINSPDEKNSDSLENPILYTPDIRELRACIDRKLAHVPIEFKDKMVHIGENTETGEDVWGFKSYSLQITPGYSINEIHPRDAELIDQIKDLTEKFSSNLK